MDCFWSFIHAKMKSWTTVSNPFSSLLELLWISGVGTFHVFLHIFYVYMCYYSFKGEVLEHCKQPLFLLYWSPCGLLGGWWKGGGGVGTFSRLFFFCTFILCICVITVSRIQTYPFFFLFEFVSVFLCVSADLDFVGFWSLRLTWLMLFLGLMKSRESKQQ